MTTPPGDGAAPAGNPSGDANGGNGGTGNPSGPTPPASPANPAQPVYPKVAGVPDGVDPNSPEGLKANADHWKAVARKIESDGKENAKKAKAFDDAAEASKTDLQKATERAEKAEAEAATASLREARSNALSEFHLDASYAPFVFGSTAEEVRESTQQLDGLIQKAQDFVLEMYGVKQPGQPAPAVADFTPKVPASPGRRPVESLRPGNLPVRNAPASDRNEQLRDAIREGQFRR